MYPGNQKNKMKKYVVLLQETKIPLLLYFMILLYNKFLLFVHISTQIDLRSPRKLLRALSE